MKLMFLIVVWLLFCDFVSSNEHYDNFFYHIVDMLIRNQLKASISPFQASSLCTADTMRLHEIMTELFIVRL